MQVGYHGWRHTARPRTVAADFAAAARWLTDLHGDSAGAREPIDLLAANLDRIAARWPAWRARRDLRSALAPVGSRLGAARTPRTVVHGDFWAGNILITDGAVTGVVDWEAGAPCGEPLRDVARFALSYSLYLDRHTRAGRRVAGHRGLRAVGWGAGIVHLLDGDGWYPRQVRGFVVTALDRLGAPGALWRDVLLGGIAEVAATADHPAFAAHHRDLLLRLATGGRS
jgi:hypothetical protein